MKLSSKTCAQWPPLGHKNSDRCWQVVVGPRLFIWGSQYLEVLLVITVNIRSHHSINIISYYTHGESLFMLSLVNVISRLMGSHFKIPFTITYYKKQLVIAIIRIMLSLLVTPKVITLSGFYCSTYVYIKNLIEKNSKNVKS